MGELDQVYETFNRRKREYNKEENIEFKRKEKQAVYELIDKAAEKTGVSMKFGLLGQDYVYDMVRIGGFLYGINVNQKLVPNNVFSLYTKVLQKYEVAEGTFVGYGANHKTSRNTKIAIISIGYADGIKRSLSNKGQVLFYDEERFFKAPIIGNISMDLIACDVTDVPEKITNVYSKAAVIDKNYSINEMALDAGTIAYEILTSINFKSKRFEIKYTSCY